MPLNHKSVIALDVGTVRIGVAVASLAARFPRPLQTLTNDENFTDKLLTIIENNQVERVIVGLPRGLDGQDTGQTEFVRAFVLQLASSVKLPMLFQDEALSSRRAKEELELRGLDYDKGDVDALAAALILEDYLRDSEV